MKNKILFSILIIGFLLKIIYILQIDNTVINFIDAHEYDAAAMSLLEEHRFPEASPYWFSRAPFYSLFLSSLYFFSPQNYLLIKIVQSFLITVIAFFLFKIAKSLFSTKAALISTAIFSFHPYFIDISARLQTESVFLFWSILTLYFLLKFARSNSRFSLLFISGILSGMAILTRPAFIIFLPVAIIWFFVLRRKLNFVFKSSLILIFSCLLVLSPWIARNFVLFNEFIYCNDSGGYMFYIGNSKENYERLTTDDPKRFKYLNTTGIVIDNIKEQVKEFEKNVDYHNLSPRTKEKLWYSTTFVYIKSLKTKWAKLLFLKMKEYLRPYLHPMCYPKKYVLISLFLNSIIYLLGVGGLFLALKNKKLKKETALFVLYFLAGIFTHTLYHAMNRYRIVFMDPYLYLFASYALVTLVIKKGKPGERLELALKDEGVK